MVREQEILGLRAQLENIASDMRDDISKISALRLKIQTEYRRRYRNRYDAERLQIIDNIRKNASEMDTIRFKLTCMGV